MGQCLEIGQPVSFHILSNPLFTINLPFDKRQLTKKLQVKKNTLNPKVSDDGACIYQVSSTEIQHVISKCEHRP